MSFFWRKDPPHESPAARLLRLGEFSLSDLATNQAGELSEAQKEHLQHDYNALAKAGWLVGMLLIAMSVCNSVFHFSHDASDTYIVWIGLGIILVPSIIAVRLWQDVYRNRVKTVSGQLVSIMKRHHSSYGVLLLDENNERVRFRLTSPFHKALKETQHYTLYYLPITKLIVSAEHIPSP